MRSIMSKTTAPITIVPLIFTLLVWFAKHGGLQFEIGWSYCRGCGSRKTTPKPSPGTAKLLGKATPTRSTS